MKKLYQEKKWRDHSINKSRKIIRYNRYLRASLLRDEERWKIRERNVKKGNATKIVHKPNGVSIHAPVVFSFRENLEPTLQFFSHVYKQLRGKEKVHLDLLQIKKITSGAILYLLLILEYDKTIHGGNAMIWGNLPKDEESRLIMIQSGFLNFVKTKSIQHEEGDTILSVKSGSKVETQKAASALQFSEYCRFDRTDLGCRKSYRAIIECMSNTENHAYSHKGEKEKLCKWWMMAIHYPEDNSIQFSVVDNGKGIPRTLRKKIHEQIFEKIGKHVLRDENLLTSDSALIMSALQNKAIRTRTELPNRGLGLPSIYSAAKEGHIYDLFVLSNNGVVRGIDNAVNLPNRFYGTFVSWRIKVPEGDTNG